MEKHRRRHTVIHHYMNLMQSLRATSLIAEINEMRKRLQSEAKELSIIMCRVDLMLFLRRITPLSHIYTPSNPVPRAKFLSSIPSQQTRLIQPDNRSRKEQNTRQHHRVSFRAAV